MDDDTETGALDGASPSPGERVRWGARFSPQVLVFVATVALASRPLMDAITSGVCGGGAIPTSRSSS